MLWQGCAYVFAQRKEGHSLHTALVYLGKGEAVLALVLEKRLAWPFGYRIFHVKSMFSY